MRQALYYPPQKEMADAQPDDGDTTMADSEFLDRVGDTSTAEYASYAKEMREDGWTAFMRDDNASAFAQAYCNATGRKAVMRSGFGGRIELHHA